MASWADELDIDDSDILEGLGVSQLIHNEASEQPWRPTSTSFISDKTTTAAAPLESHNPSTTASGVLKRFQKSRASQYPHELPNGTAEKKRKHQFHTVSSITSVNKEILRFAGPHSSNLLEDDGPTENIGLDSQRGASNVLNVKDDELPTCNDMLHLEDVQCHSLSDPADGTGNDDCFLDDPLLLDLQKTHGAESLLSKRKFNHIQLQNADNNGVSKRIQAHILKEVNQFLEERPLTTKTPELHARDLHTSDRGEVPNQSNSRKLPYRIPGPAGAVQRGQRFERHQLNSAYSMAKNKSVFCQGTIQDDSDFQSGAWLSATKYIEKSSTPVSTIWSIKTSRKGNRIPKLVAVIKTCVLNGTGDVTVNLKDQSDNITGTINTRVMTETEYGNLIEPGSVIILQQVVVFSPTPFAHYLNITVNNVEMVFSKELASSASNSSQKKVNLVHNVDIQPIQTARPRMMDSSILQRLRDTEILEIDSDGIPDPLDHISTQSEQQAHEPQPCAKADFENQNNLMFTAPDDDVYDQLLDDLDLFQCLQVRSAAL